MQDWNTMGGIVEDVEDEDIAWCLVLYSLLKLDLPNLRGHLRSERPFYRVMFRRETN